MKNKNLIKTALAAPLLALALVAAPLGAASAQTAKAADKAYSYVEQMPEFKGGEKEMLTFLGSNIQYPKDAVENGLEGLVVVSFVVETDGTISEAKSVKTLGRGTDEEALRVVRLMSGHWNAGRQNGEAVRVRYTLPIRFAMSESDRKAAADKANRPPQFKGGQEAMYQTMLPYLALPAEAKQENLNARVVVKFYVDKAGTVSNIRLEGTKLKKTVGPDSDLDYMDASTFQLQNKALLAQLSESAMSAVKATSGKWEPATKNGQAIGAELVLPVQFLGTTAAKNEKEMQTPSMTKYTKSSYTYEEADVKPVLQDGPLEKYLAKNLRYPADATFEGDVDVYLIIKEDGKVISMLPVAVGKELHDEISNVLQSTQGKWTPGKVDGQSVPVSRKLVIRFVTNGGSSPSEASSTKPADVVVTRYK
ncbi:TonB family protein [Pontibacter roseus]|uniref:TonB family protein n=1 Tax=Pontibacter roseus TaxID=336989 RepID=UPI0003804E5C|nr:TonB family protein [Pontibacter roseus]